MIEAGLSGLMTQIARPPGQAVTLVRPEVAPPAPPGGPDWTRGMQPRGATREAEMVRVAALGRARALLMLALDSDEPIERERRIASFLLRLIDPMLEGADVRTFLDGLLS